MTFLKNTKWISDPAHDGTPMRPITLFRKNFDSKSSGNAVLNIAALGIYEIRLDGQPITDEIFAPGWSDYRFRTEMRTYSFPVQSGCHMLDIFLAGGWYCGYIAGTDAPHVPALIASLEFPGGTVKTGKSWLCASDGPWLYSDFYMGESFDSASEFHEFREPLIVDPKIVIEQFTGSPIRRTVVVEPVAINGNIVDFGINLAGREIITFNASPGTRITLRHAEVLDADGRLYTENLREAVSVNTVIAAGGEQTYEPLFTYHGFRYLEVTGITDFTVNAAVIGADFKFHSRFDSDNPLLNRLTANIRRGWRANSLSAPTDCPQRDERAGWLGDAQVFIRAALYLSDCSVFFRRWLKDVRLGASPDGDFPVVAPFLTRFKRFGDAGWADAGVICPWTLYEFTHNTDILAENLPSMLKFVRQRKNDATDLIFRRAIYGDWLNQNADTPKSLIGTAFFARSADLTSRAASVLGHDSEAAEMHELFEKIRQTFERCFGNELKTQTALALALHFNLLSESGRAGAAAELNQNVREERGGHLSTGFLGTPYLLHALSDNGYAATAWHLLEETTCPSWLFQVVHGATTVWEHWDSCSERGFKASSMNSFNHYAYGAVYDWIIGYAAGIAPDLEIDPHPGGSLRELSASYLGLSVSWRKEKDRVSYGIEVPSGMIARFRNQTLTEGKHLFKEDL